MIPTVKQEAEVLSTVEGNEYKMMIDEDSVDHIMGVLTNLYSDPELAVIREYSTNAWDAHIESGQTRPIEVTTPSEWSPVFRVQDWGPGLSEEDVERVYSRYGRSTKRGSNQLVGYLGLGSKSALAYTSQFTVTSVKDGHRIIVLVSRDEDGTGRMTVVANEETSDPSGVAVEVPAKTPSKFTEKTEKFFRYWPAGAVLVNCKAPTRVGTSLQVTPTIELVRGPRNGALVMGNVPYPINWEEIYEPSSGGYRYRYGEFITDWSIVAHVPIGAVQLAPSREGLEYTERTKRVLREIRDAVLTGCEDAVQREVERAPSMHDAFKRAAEFRDTLRKRDMQLVYRGQAIPLTISGHFIVTEGRKKDHWYRPGRYRDVGKYTLAQQLSAQYFSSENAWVTGFSDHFSHVTKKKLWAWWEANHPDTPLPQHFVLVNALPLNPWIGSITSIPWEAVKAIKLTIPKTNRAAGGPVVTSYDVWSGAKYWKSTPLTQLDRSRPIYYVKSTDQADHWQRHLLNLHADGKFYLLRIPPQRHAKFMKLVPEATEARAGFVTAALAWWGSLSHEERTWLVARNSDAARALRDLPQVGVKDERLARATRAAQSAPSAELVKRWDVFERWIHDVKREQLTLIKAIEPYPLLRGRQYGEDPEVIRRHNLAYVNAIYSQQQQEGTLAQAIDPTTRAA